MAWDPSLNPLRNELACLYPSRRDCARVLESAAVPLHRIDFEGSAVNMWHGAISEAVNQNLFPELVAVVASEYPRNEVINRFSVELAARVINGLDSETIAWHLPVDSTNAEKILGAMSSLVPVRFLQQAWAAQRAVSRIRLPRANATGFLTNSNLLITNHHVIPNSQVASRAIVEFNFQENVLGGMEPMATYGLVPENGFATSQSYDWTAVRVSGDPNSDWGAIEVNSNDVSIGDRVNIIQHPSGRPKEMSFFHNRVEYVDDYFIQYLTDTEPGSSGSPVFDRNWNLVAVHHAGGLLSEPLTSRAYYRNEGIRASLIAEGIASLKD